LDEFSFEQVVKEVWKSLSGFTQEAELESRRFDIDFVMFRESIIKFIEILNIYISINNEFHINNKMAENNMFLNNLNVDNKLSIGKSKGLSSGSGSSSLNPFGLNLNNNSNNLFPSTLIQPNSDTNTNIFNQNIINQISTPKTT